MKPVQAMMVTGLAFYGISLVYFLYFIHSKNRPAWMVTFLTSEAGNKHFLKHKRRRVFP